MQTTPAETRRIPLASIAVQAGFNPRHAFRPAAMERLVDSIRESGLLQPILVRPRTDDADGFWIVAGERRFRACTTLGLEDVPALIRDLDDNEARLVALLENIDRADLSPAEEALAARDALDLAQGDKAATASRLGWSASKLDARLLLLTASPAVLQALAEGTIHVGHAELLAGLPEAQQDKALTRIVEHNVSIAELREQVKGILIPLASAVFDTSACAKCPFNTQLQGSLFGDAVQGAFCKHRACFTEKTRAELESKRDALQDDVGTVALASEKDPASYTTLTIDGEKGVGKVQFEQCRRCPHFGAIINDRLDGRTGQVTRPVCFNLACHSEKVKVHQDALAEAEATKAEAATSAPDSTVPMNTHGTKPTSAPAKAKKPPVRAAAPAASSTAALKAMVPAYRAAAKDLLANDPRVALAVALASLQKLLSATSIKDDPAHAPVKGNFEESVAALSGMDGGELAARLRDTCSLLLTGTLVNAFVSRSDAYPSVTAARLVQSSGIDLANYFTVSDAYLAAHTREGILSILAEAGFDAWLKGRDDGDKRWKAITNAKKADLPKLVMEAGFNWQGFVPAAVKTAKPRSFVGV